MIFFESARLVLAAALGFGCFGICVSYAVGDEINPWLEALGQREASVVRLGAIYSIEVGELEPVSTSREDGESHVQACAAAAFLKSDLPATPVVVERDFVSAALHVRLGDFGEGGNELTTFEEFFFDGDKLERLMGVDKNSRVQAEITKEFDPQLATYSTGHPRPDTLTLTPVGYAPLSEVLRAAAERPLDHMRRSSLTVSPQDAAVVCVFKHLEPAVIPGHGLGNRESWHRVHLLRESGGAYPVRVDELNVHGDPDLPRVTYLLEEHRDVNGVLLPFRIRALQYMRDRTLASVLTVQEWTVNENVEMPAELDVPPGTSITDLIANRRVRKAMSPDEIDIRVNQTTSRIHESAHSGGASLRQWLVIGNLVGVGVIGLCAYLIRRRRQPGG